MHQNVIVANAILGAHWQTLWIGIFINAAAFLAAVLTRIRAQEARRKGSFERHRLYLRQARLLFVLSITLFLALAFVVPLFFPLAPTQNQQHLQLFALGAIVLFGLGAAFIVSIL